MKSKNILSPIVLFLSVFFTFNLLSLNDSLAAEMPSQRRIPPIYLKETEGQERVMLIGNGHRAGISYPKNYYLVDINELKQPDLQADITKIGSLPEGFVKLFDVVIWEGVDLVHIIAPGTLANIHAVLKPEGYFISNMLVDVQSKSLLHSTKRSELRTLEPGIEYFPLDTKNLMIPFLCYISDVAMSNAEQRKVAIQKCFEGVFKVWIEGVGGFKNAHPISSTPYWKNVPPADGYISVQKK